MSTSKKFSSKMDEKVLDELRQFSSEQNLEIATILTLAVKDFLNKNHVRPAFTQAADETFEEFDADLKELAK